MQLTFILLLFSLGALLLLAFLLFFFFFLSLEHLLFLGWFILSSNDGRALCVE